MPDFAGARLGLEPSSTRARAVDTGSARGSSVSLGGEQPQLLTLLSPALGAVPGSTIACSFRCAIAELNSHRAALVRRVVVLSVLASFLCCRSSCFQS
jgi:hypothetical protein